MDFTKLLEKFNIADHINVNDFGLDKVADLAKDSLDSIMKINEAASARAEQLFKMSSDIINETVEGTINQVKSLADTKNPEDFINSQVTYATELGKKAVENSQKYVDFMVEAQSEIGGLVQDTIAKK
ncbi:MAG: phasin family protein [Gammaproteobacteria bacterium]|nr:MAG: phasin family protein [Gammaproteobacteria bacterium]